MTDRALARLDKIIANGSDRDALEGIKLLLSRSMPEPKQTAAVVVNTGGSGAHMAALADKARLRLTADNAKPVQTVGETVFAPLVGVQKSEQ